MPNYLFKYLSILFIFLAIAGFSYHNLKLEYNKSLVGRSLNEALYLPRGEGLQFMSFGYKNALAHLLWFNTINYFGKHYQGNRDYRWLSHMCGLVTNLNSKMTYVYEFCGLMLAWEAKLPDKSIALLSDGISNNPNYWKLPYLRGMTYLVFNKDDAKATSDFVLAAKLPEAHTGVLTLAAKKLSVTENPETAIDFLKETIANSKDAWERQVLSDRLRELILQKDLSVLEKAIEIYQQRTSTIPEDLEDLIEQGIIKSLPLDPYGNTYFLNKLSGKPESKSQKNGTTDSNTDR